MQKSLIKMCVLFCFIFLKGNFLFSQDLNQLKREAAKAGVSSAQVNKIIKAVDANNLIPSDVNEQSRTNANNSAIERSNVIENINKINKTNSSINQNEISIVTSNQSEDLGSEKVNSKNEISVFNDKDKNITISENFSLKYFGYDIFKNNPEVFQNSNLESIGPNYVIGPGDEIIIMLWGATEQINTYAVARDGYIFIDDVGQVFVNGLTIEKVEKKLKKLFKKSFSTIDGNGFQQNTYFDISLGAFSMRSKRIHIVGNVNQPGAYSMNPSVSLFSSLFYFKGPSSRGSLRDIKLLRDDKEIASIDFYDYLITGNKGSDIKLETDDVVFIPNRKKTVTVRGEINEPAIYELKDNEGLDDVIIFSGGLKSTTYHKRIQINRIVPIDKRDAEGADRIIIDVNFEQLLSNKKSFDLYDGDEIVFYKINENKNKYVKISGAINRPGTYGFTPGLSINDIIKKADGITGDAFSDRIDLVRMNADLTTSLINHYLSDIIENPNNPDYLLQSGDEIRVYLRSELEFSDELSITGHVLNPGIYPFRNNMVLRDLVFAGGGFENDDHIKNAYMSRADLIRHDEESIKKNIIPFRLDSLLAGGEIGMEELKMGDGVRIYNRNIFYDYNQVNINGSINNPGDYQLRNEMTLKNLILEAGGLKSEVFSFAVEIARRQNYNYDYSEFNSKPVEILFFQFVNTETLYSDGSNPDAMELQIKLEPFDRITIRKEPDIAELKIVEISGYVKYPGTYVLSGSEDFVSDIITRAGGLTADAYPTASFFERDGKQINLSFEKIIKNPRSRYNFKLSNNDKITINSFTNIVTIGGEVNNPGNYQFIEGKRYRDYVGVAGGFTKNAARSSSFIVYPDGSTKNINFLNMSPKVLDGSKINVVSKAVVEKFNFTEYVTNLTSIYSDILQAYLIIIAIGNQG
jgi:polysaccharide biosynthesis/export protein